MEKCRLKKKKQTNKGKESWEPRTKTNTEKQTERWSGHKKRVVAKERKSRKIWTEGCWTMWKEGQAGKEPREVE